MNEKNKKILNITLICAVIIMTIVAIVETIILLNLHKKLDDLKDDYSQIQEQLENME